MMELKKCAKASNIAQNYICFMAMQSDQLAPAPVADQNSERSRRAQEILQLFRVVFRSVQQHSNWVESRCGVSAAQLWAMWELMQSPGMKVSELSKAMAIHQSTTSNLLDKLENKRLIRRERGQPDQRVVRLFLTAEGSAIIEQAPRPAQGVLTDALSRLPESVLENLGQGIEMLVAQINMKDEKAAMEPLSGT
jgi:MarR family transcriptional regulator, organic hydroperoxide resistance regulator